MKQGLLFILFAVLSFSAFATHERAGEITFKYISGNTYELTITTYTKGTSSPADRCTQVIFFGDGDSAIVCRSNFEPGDPTTDAWNANGCTGNPNCTTHHMGEWNIASPTLFSLNIKKNVYTITHTYSGTGTYIVHMTDPDRNGGIVNVPDQTPFSVQDTLKINPLLGPNSSPVLNFPPIDKACIGKIFIHNPAAVDPDGDSLSYKLGVCYEDYNTPIAPPNYFIPPGVSVNALTGDLIWNTPKLLGNPYGLPYEYNFAMDIEEWRKFNGKYWLIGTVRRDLQVRVYNCLNDPPIVDAVNDTCILENTALTLTVTAHDQGGNDLVSFAATGGPFSTTPAATFTLLPPALKYPTAKGVFKWKPSCDQVRLQPYTVTFKAVDDGAPDIPPLQLSDYKSFNIKVIAPAPKNLTVSPQCSEMNLQWDAEVCNPGPNALYQYKIFRKDSCDTLKHQYCETGMPSYWGYKLLATVPFSSTSYKDINGLVHGKTYVYRVDAVFLDGAESYISDPACAKLLRDVPIITNVDVITTDPNTGSINVKWLKPLADSANFDTLHHPGPYKFELLRATGNATPVPPAIATFTSTTFAGLTTTTYLDQSLNTSGSAYTYRVDFYDSLGAPCPAQQASSIFLVCNPNDNQIQFTWNEHVPWVNTSYVVYKKNSLNNWDSIGTTAAHTFTDTGLVNGAIYCYKVKSIGAYPDTSLPRPLINWSQEMCCSPMDKTPPCANEITVNYNCEYNQNDLSWTNPNSSCSDDAVYYIIYHTDSIGGDYHAIDTIPDINILLFIDDSLNSIAGCYAITSVDSFGNESAYSNIVCVDNCPYYELPNVFTPNGDGHNDLFTPLHPYKFVKDIDIQIFNRWGNIVFRTHDPEIGWDGKSIQTKMLCADGVYYYACIVNDIRLRGIVPHTLTGFITLLSNK